MLVTARITKSYRGRLVLGDFELAIADGEIVALLGESGSGKSTLAKIVVGAESPDPGSSIDIRPGVSIAYAPQQAELAEWRSAAENVSLERELVCPDEAVDRDEVSRLLSLVDLSEVADQYPDQLSVGMRQRLQLSRALYTSAHLIVIDEPLSAVDELRREEIAERVRALLKARNGAALWITHDIAEAVQVADRVIVLRSPTQGGQSEIGIEKDARGQGRITLSEPERQLRQMLRARGNAPVEVVIPPMAVGKLENRSLRRMQLLAPLYVLAALLLTWQLAVSAFPQGSFFFSSPMALANTLTQELAGARFWMDVGWTAMEAAAGLSLGLAAGVAIGLAAAASPRMAMGFRPYLVGATAVPLFVLAPAFIIWFGVGLWMKIALAALSSAPIVALGMIEPFEIEGAEFSRHLLRRGVPRWRLFARYTLPQGMLAFLMVLRPAAVAALIGAFLGEFISAEKGLGYYILLNASRYHIEEVLVGAIALFAMALLVQAAMKILISRRIQVVRALGL